MASFKVFAVVLLNPSEEVKDRVMAEYAGSFEYNDTFFLVKTPDTVLSVEVAETVGLGGTDRVQSASGFVIQQRGNYNGYTRRDLWEWLSALDEEDDDDV